MNYHSLHSHLSGSRPTERETKFYAELKNLEKAQSRKLLSILAGNARSYFGQVHRFENIRSVEEYREQVPLVSYEDLVPEIEEIERGTKNRLTEQPVLRFHLSSGTRSASKRIPFTEGLRDEFAAAIELWLWNLFDHFPDSLSRPGYWVITPSNIPPKSDSAVPSCFDSDGAYIPSGFQRWFAATQAVPGELASVECEHDFFRITATILIATPELGLLSLWSPSFWQSLSSHILSDFSAIVEDFDSGLKDFEVRCRRRRVPIDARVFLNARQRGRELALAGSKSSPWKALWPKLGLISCWDSAWAARFLDPLVEAFPEVPIQGKGLLATEGVVTIPFAESADDTRAPVLLPGTHFYEFRHAENRKLFLAHELQDGETYEVILSTSGGLYRYELGDLVRVSGAMFETPRLEFVGKLSGVSDLCGEKLHAEHVERCLATVLPNFGLAQAFAFLAPSLAEAQPNYRLFLAAAVEETQTRILASEIEQKLLENFNYSSCRKNGQLGPLEVHLVDRDASLRYERSKGTSSRLSTRKVRSLETEAGWEEKLC